MLLGRYLADGPVEDIRCVAQTRATATAAPSPSSPPTSPPGSWRLLPRGPQRGQLALPAQTMAVYDLSHLPYAEQLRWRTQRCPAHAATHGAADLALAGWQVFDPLLHAQHLRTALPYPPHTASGER